MGDLTYDPENEQEDERLEKARQIEGERVPLSSLKGLSGDVPHDEQVMTDARHYAGRSLSAINAALRTYGDANFSQGIPRHTQERIGELVVFAQRMAILHRDMLAWREKHIGPMTAAGSYD